MTNLMKSYRYLFSLVVSLGISSTHILISIRQYVKKGSYCDWNDVLLYEQNLSPTQAKHEDLIPIDSESAKQYQSQKMQR